jgi:hypothetical protein
VAFFLVDVLHAADALFVFVGVLARAAPFSVRRSTQQPVHNSFQRSYMTSSLEESASAATVGCKEGDFYGRIMDGGDHSFVLRDNSHNKRVLTRGDSNTVASLVSIDALFFFDGIMAWVFALSTISALRLASPRGHGHGAGVILIWRHWCHSMDMAITSTSAFIFIFTFTFTFTFTSISHNMHCHC